MNAFEMERCLAEAFANRFRRGHGYCAAVANFHRSNQPSVQKIVTEIGASLERHTQSLQNQTVKLATLFATDTKMTVHSHS